MNKLQVTKFDLVYTTPGNKPVWSTPVGKEEGSPLMRTADLREWLQLIQDVHGPIMVEYAKDVAEDKGASLFLFWRVKEH